MLLAPGEIFAGFTIERELGAGGMGVVYLARHPRLPRRVALKLLRTDLGADPSFVGRFRREADTVARLDHPNIVAIDDSGADDGMLWISMRFIDGDTAAGALAEYDAGMPPERAVHIVERVASALDFAHRQNIVHRDVKPANILLTDDVDGDHERVFLTDFGVAKAMGEIEAQATALTQAGGVVATLDYAAPEQIEGKQLDGRCDVYALGCVLYKLLTGVIPYPGETLAAKVYARMHRPPPIPTELVPDLPPAFDKVVAKALAMDREDRYQTCKELAVAARAAIGTGEIRPSDTGDLTVAAGTTSTERIDAPDPDPDATRHVGTPGGTGGTQGGPGPVGPQTGPERSGPQSRPPQSRPPQSPPPQSPPPQSRPPQSRPPQSRPPHSTALFPVTPSHTDPRASQFDGGPQHGASQGYTSAGSLPADLAEQLGPGLATARDHPELLPRPRRSRRRLLPLAIGALVLIVAIVGGIFLVQRKASIAGTGSVTGLTSAATTPKGGTTNSGPATSGPAKSGGALVGPATSGVATSGANSSSAPQTENTAVPVAGLPQSEPITDGTIVVSRQYTLNGKTVFALFYVDSYTGVVGGPFTEPKDHAQNPLIALQRGSVIYLQGDAANQNTLRVVAPDGKGDRVLFNRPADCQQISRPAWNPVDTQQLVIACQGKLGLRTLMVVNLKGTVSKTLPISDGLYPGDDLAFAPDGKSIVYWGSTSATANDGRLYTQTTDGVGQPTPITDEGSHDADPDYSPDGSQIVFRRLVDGNGQIALVPAKGGAVTVLTTTPSNSQGPVFSPNGTQIAYKSNLGDDGKAGKVNRLWILNTAKPYKPEVKWKNDAGMLNASPAWGNR
ncbi:serine/threonine protein kinase [Nakamurella sp. UYEF19]|uniref:protein kinase domain-containing protein n=1 Tax=Nakamurella sp. UYEF19 TaxID=1756392 RepID=UPI00339572F2